MRRVLLIGALLFTASMTCRADTFQTFDFQGSIYNGLGSASGTLTVDETTGAATAIDITASLFSVMTTFTTIDSQSLTFLSDYRITSTGSAAGTNLTLVLPVSTLVGYGGGPICGFSTQNCVGIDISEYFQAQGGYDFDSGTLTPEVVAATPEPSSLALLGSGALGLAGVLRRRKCC